MSARPQWNPNPAMYVTPVPSHSPDATRIPGPPPMPTNVGQTEPSTGPPPTQLDLIEDRLAKLEDAIHSPDGVLHTLFGNLVRLMTAQHEETMRTLTTIANGQADISNRMAQIEPQVEEHDARLHLLRPAE